LEELVLEAFIEGESDDERLLDEGEWGPRKAEVDNEEEEEEEGTAKGLLPRRENSILPRGEEMNEIA
jgi:hypothetical protein